MSSKKYNIINYAAKYLPVIEDYFTGSFTTIKIPSEIDGVTIPLKESAFQRQHLLTEIDFNRCTVIPQFCCSSLGQLQTVRFAPGTSSVGNNAFYNVKADFGERLPDTITKIGDNAFESTDNQRDLAFHAASPAVIGNAAFRYSALTELTGDFTRLLSSCCQSARRLRKVHINSIGSSLSTTVFSNAFFQCGAVDDFYINPQTDLKFSSYSSNAFSAFGLDRSDPQNNWFFWDLRCSNFTEIPTSCWSDNTCSSFLLPQALKNITSHAFDGKNIKVYLNSLPSLASTNAFKTEGLSIVVDYQLDETVLKEATNWSVFADYISAGIIGIIGDLPPYMVDTGVSLTWYADQEKTIPVTTSTNPNTLYYASKGSEREVWAVRFSGVNASPVVSDGTTTYDKFIPVGTAVTVSASPTDPNKTQLYFLEVDGVECTAAGSATVLADHDIRIKAVFWDGVVLPFAPDLADNELFMIKLASKVNQIPNTWKVGDEITVKYDGLDYKCRLVDKTGKFTRTSDGSTAYLYFEFENLLPEYLAYGSEASPMSSSLLASMNSGDIWSKIDPDLRDVLEDVDVAVAHSAGSTDASPLPFKLFLPREKDILSSRMYSTSAEWNAVTAQDEYYQMHNSDADRRKAKLLSPTSYASYWDISPMYQNSANVCVVYSTGNGNVYSPSSGVGVSPRFAL